METPICDFIKNYGNNRAIRLHMPGHKGKGGKEIADITEISGADSLFDASGIILQSEQNAQSLFGSGETCYSAEGSSLCIKTMVYAVCQIAKKKGESPLILATRNCHQSFIYALGLSGAKVEWLYDENQTLLSLNLTAQTLEKKLAQMETLPHALYLTSPDYLGGELPVGELSKVCKKFGVLLVVDNAHGSYKKFLKVGLHPLDLGADLCCDSSHKTLPVLTGGAYLHLGKNCNLFTKEELKSFMKIFASTSPSYLILASLDKVNKYIFENKQAFLRCEKRVKSLKNRLIDACFTLFGTESFKITISTKPFGYTGLEVKNYLEDRGVVVEYFDSDFIVLMFSPSLSLTEFKRVESVILSLPKKPSILTNPPKIIQPKKAMEISQALFSAGELVRVENALGRVLQNGSVSCPPAVSPIVPGEIIDQNVLKVLSYYSIEKVYVVKN